MIDKMNPAAVAGLYSDNQAIGKGTGTTAKEDGASFGDLVKKVAQDSVDTMREGERMSAQAVLGQADLTDVVEAVSAAELTLSTVVAVRDRMMSSFQEIMRMPI